MGSASSAITIELNGTQPFMMGQQITGTVSFNNTQTKSIKVQKIYAEFVGRTIHTTYVYNGSSVVPVVNKDLFFNQMMILEEKPDEINLDNGFHSWPVSFSPPSLLPPSLNQLTSDGPYLDYKIRVVVERSEKLHKNISQKIPVHLIAHPSSYLHPSFLPVEAENKTHSDIILHTALNNQNNPIKPNDTCFLDVELHNPKHIKIKCLSIDLVQNRTLWKAGHCSLKVPLSNPPDLQEFSGENYRQTLPLVIPDDDRIISSFRYLPSSTSEKLIAVEYVLKLEIKAHGLFNNIVQNIPVIVHQDQADTFPLSDDIMISTD